MQRRSFIKRLFGVATAAVVSESVIPDDGVALTSIPHPNAGADITYDLTEESLEQVCIDLAKEKGRSGIMTRADFRAQLKEGLDTVFRLQYKDCPEDFAEFAEEKTRSELDRVKLIG